VGQNTNRNRPGKRTTLTKIMVISISGGKIFHQDPCITPITKIKG
jgi:hypothetical protein